MRTLLLKLALCAAVIFAPVSAMAQGFGFEKLAKVKGVEYIHMDKEIISQAAKNGETLRFGETTIADGDSEVLNYLDDVFIFTSKQEKGAKKMKNEVQKVVKDDQWKILVDMAGDEGEKIKLYQTKNEQKTTNLVLAELDGETVLILLVGTFDIAELIEKYTNGDYDEGDFEWTSEEDDSENEIEE